MRKKHRKGSRPFNNKKKQSWNSSKPGNSGGRRPPRADDYLLTRDQMATARTATQKTLAEWLEQPAPFVPEGEIDQISGVHLDPWQKEAVDALRAGKSVIVDAPTTAGKTRVVESYFETWLSDSSFRAAYTTPVKSLSNDKLREFRQKYGHDNVGIATGDIKENLDAPIVVATLESYRNSLLGVEPDLKRSMVVFDEYHYLQDPGRGSAWEEAIILTPPSCQILMLSASVSNAGEIRGWMDTIRPQNQCELVSTLHRPVPLEGMICVDGQWIAIEHLEPKTLQKVNRRYKDLPMRHDDLVNRLTKLPDLKLTPCIVYAGRRMATETIADFLCRTLPKLDQSEAEKISEVLMQIDRECGALKFIPRNLRHSIQVYGVGVHHSGLAAPARIAIEALVKDGLLRFCVATMGLSLGINFSVRSAVISDYDRPGENGLTRYESSEVLQMLGRAGRRGRDKVGVSLWPTPEAWRLFGKPERQPVASQLKNDPTTILGLIGRGYNLPQLEQFYARSLRAFQVKHTDFKLVSRRRIEKKLNIDPPCQSPANAWSLWDMHAPGPCKQCHARSDCHKYIKEKKKQSFAAMHLHLHKIGALDENEKLTRYGEVAQFFPQAGGLLFAKKLLEGDFTSEGLVLAAQVAGACSTSWFKEPSTERGFDAPFDEQKMQKQLEAYYPIEIFPEVYDPPFGSRENFVLRDFNPRAAYAVGAWAMGEDWNKLSSIVVTNKFGVGDLMNLFFRVATYLQSIAGCPLPEYKSMAIELRRLLLRSPLDFVLTAQDSEPPPVASR